ncbi:MAG: hypothetical protein M0R06_18610 [Sphaerochaeta sp.]|nr:hypothetical protein [Sphaerochaeta sp.]
MTKCAKCGELTNKSSLVNGAWLCPNCHPFLGAWSKTEKIRSRVRMPDGRVLQGLQAQRISDARRRAQEKAA